MFELAHISDVHLGLTSAPSLREFSLKRTAGYLNILRKRGANHQDWALDVITRSLVANKPDHIAVTGDLINLALTSEFQRAFDWLAALGSPDRVSLVPGNHDTYVAMRPGVELWQPYFSGDGNSAQAPNVRWPYLRKRGSVALIGISTAVPTAPLRATGRVGEEQLAHLEELLKSTGDEELFRVVMIHHPPLPVPTPNHKRLIDAQAFADVLARHGAELVIHGHNHTDTLFLTPGPATQIPVVGIPSASAIGIDGRPAAQYNLYRFEKRRDGWHVGMSAHRLDPERRAVNGLYSRELIPALGEPVPAAKATDRRKTPTTEGKARRLKVQSET